MIRDATHKTGALRVLTEAIDEKRAALVADDIQTLRTRLDGYEDLPTVAIDGDGCSEDRAVALARRIQADKAREHREKHRDIWMYLTLTGRLAPRHVLSLSAYMSLADHHAPQSDVFEKSIDLGITDAVLSAGAVQGLQLAGVSLVALAGPLQVGVAAAAGCFAKRWIRQHTSPRLPAYVDFHNAFYEELEGQADAVYDQVQAFLGSF